MTQLEEDYAHARKVFREAAERQAEAIDVAMQQAPIMDYHMAVMHDCQLTPIEAVYAADALDEMGAP